MAIIGNITINNGIAVITVDADPTTGGGLSVAGGTIAILEGFDSVWVKGSGGATDWNQFTLNSATQTLTNKTLTSPVINVGSDATGDIYYRNSGGNFTRLGIGSDGQVLKIASGLPIWDTVSGSGTVTSVSAGTGMSFTTITTTGSVSIDSTKVPYFAGGLSGTPDGTTYLRGDGVWSTVAGGVSDGDKGDITVTSSGTVWTIDNNVVDDARIATHTTTKISTTSKSLLNSAIVYTDQANTFGNFANRFLTSTLAVRNPADTFSYIFAGSAIVADRTITLPLLTSGDILVTEAFTQTLTNKTLTSPTINGGTHTAITSLGIRDTSAAFDVTIAATSSTSLTASRTLTLDMVNAARTIKLAGNIDLAANFTTSGANSLTLTTTSATNVTLPTTGTLVNTDVTTLSSLASVGTITSGTWNGSVINSTYGGTGVNNGGRTLTINTNSGTISFTTSVTLTVAATASISGTNTGDQTTITGNAGTATALQTARTINGTSFDGTANITVTAAAGTLTGTTLNSTVVTSSLTSFGTVTSGTLSTGAVIGGVTMTLGSDATGDIYYRNSGGVLTRLPVSTNGFVLTLSGGLPTWAAGGAASLTVGSSSISSGTAGRILFEGSGNVLQESASLFWSTTNSSLYVGSSSGDVSALLDLISTSKGFGLMSMTTAQRDAITSPRDGLFAYISDGTIGLSARISSAWVSLPNLPLRVTIPSPSSSENLTLMYTTTQVKVSRILSVIRGGTSVTFSIRYGSDRSAAGTEVVTSGITCSNTTTGNSTTSFNSATIPANNFIWITTTAKSGAVTELAVSIAFN